MVIKDKNLITWKSVIVCRGCEVGLVFTVIILSVFDEQSTIIIYNSLALDISAIKDIWYLIICPNHIVSTVLCLVLLS